MKRALLKAWRGRLARAATYMAGLAVVALVIGAAAAFDLFRAADDFGHDILATVTADDDVSDAGVLVVEVPPGRDDLWRPVIDRASAAGARAIGVVAPPAEVSLPAGVAVAPSALSGIEQARISRRYLPGTAEEPSLAVALSGVPLPQEPFLVAFPFEPRAMARVTAEQVATAAVAPELFRDRLVLVGESGDGAPDLAVPLMDVDAMDAVVFHAYATGTLLHGAAPVRAGGALTLVVVMLTVAVVAVVELFVFRLAGPLPGMMSTALLLALFYASFELAAVLLPFTGMVLGAAGAVVVVIWRRSRTRAETMHQLTLSLLSGTRERLFERHAKGEQARWDEIAVFVMQLLDLERLVVLVAEEGRPFVKERTAVNCGIEDIEEMRRDYRRSPYADALDADAMVRSPRRFLRPAVERGETEYIVPLRFAGEVQGFWAMSVVPAKAENLDGQRALVTSIANGIAERLYRARAVDGADDVGVFGQSLEDRLITAAWYGQARQRMLQEIMDASATASIAFDLFGHVLHLNRRMSEILDEAGIPAFSMTALSFIQAVTGIDETEARRRVRSVVGEGALDFLVSTIGDGRRTVQLAMRQVGQPWTGRVGQRVEMDPVKGLLCEFVDITDLTAVTAGRQKIGAFVSELLQNDLQALSIGVHLLGSDHRELAENRIREVLERMTARVGAARSLIEAPVATRADAMPVPFDMHELLSGVANDKANLGRLRIDLAMPSGLCCGDAAAVRDGLRAVLALLTEDACALPVDLVYRENGHHHVVSLFSGGGGMPASRLQDLIAGNSQIEDPTWRRVASFAHEVRRSGGRMTGSATPGGGITLTISLPGTDLLTVGLTATSG